MLSSLKYGLDQSGSKKRAHFWRYAMLRQFAYVGPIAIALTATPVYAQTAAGQAPEAAPSSTNAPAASPAPDANKSDAGKMSASPAPAPATKTTSDSDTFVTEQSVDEWRASKLAGINVYGPDDKKVGSIKDVLMDHDGNTKVIVISVGGFLGIGSKDVAIPFKMMQWRTESRASATANPPANSATGTGAGSTPTSTAAEKTTPAEVEANQGYPDRGVLSMTQEQLKNAPEFHYASEQTVAPATKP
jgi:sporulation protein YlmC with PRC-barrel domain